MYIQLYVFTKISKCTKKKKTGILFPCHPLEDPMNSKWLCNSFLLLWNVLDTGKFFRKRLTGQTLCDSMVHNLLLMFMNNNAYLILAFSKNEMPPNGPHHTSLLPWKLTKSDNSQISTFLINVSYAKNTHSVLQCYMKLDILMK